MDNKQKHTAQIDPVKTNMSRLYTWFGENYDDHGVFEAAHYQWFAPNTFTLIKEGVYFINRQQVFLTNPPSSLFDKGNAVECIEIFNDDPFEPYIAYNPGDSWTDDMIVLSDGECIPVKTGGRYNNWRMNIFYSQP